MRKQGLTAMLLLLTALSLYGNGRDTIDLSFSGGMILDMAIFGLEKKYAALGSSVQFPGSVSIGIKPQFAFNNDLWSVYLPALLSIPIPAGAAGRFALEPYAGGGAVYFSDSGIFHPLITAGVFFHYRSFFADLPIYCFLKEGDSDFLIGLNMGWSFHF
ncbi:MAG: hypothetical protein JXR86_12410 [Spirochaetales bacterium]|nr:hypothetical protein [Spirochaetales bacterium]